MPKKYNPDKRGKYAQYNTENLETAVEAVKAGMSLRKAEQTYKIPKSTINDRVKEKVQMDASKGRKPYLTKEIEKEIVEKVTTAAAKGFGISKRQLLIKVGTLCKRTAVANFKNGVPGKDWWYSFTKRNPEISLRKPEKLETKRAKMMNKEVVKDYFDELEEVIRTRRLDLLNKPECIWNADETGKQLEHTPGNVIGKKGAKNIISRTSNDRSNITIMASVNASGSKMPPMLIMKGKTFKSLYGYNTADAPENTLWTYQQKAWMNDEIGMKWFTEVFLKHCGPQRPQLLIMDGHGSHETLSILERADRENITLISLPAHTTHYLQPLDRTVFGPFNKAYNKFCSEYLAEHVCNMVNKWTFPGIFRKAWESALTPENIKSGFWACGIVPLNRFAIPDIAYLPSSVYYKPPIDIQDESSTTCGGDADTVPDVAQQFLRPKTATIVRESEQSTTNLHDFNQIEETEAAVEALLSLDTSNNLNDSSSSNNGSQLISLEPLETSSMEVDDPAHLLELIKSGSLDVIATADDNGEATLTVPSSLWSLEIDNIFSPSKKTSDSEEKASPVFQKKRKINQGHRVLTSADIIDEKRKRNDEKIKKELLKEERKRKQEENKLKKLLKQNEKSKVRYKEK